MDKLKMHTPDLSQENIEKMRSLFPNCVTEANDKNGKLKLTIDFDQLKQELSDSIVEGPQERYQLNWPGRRQAILTANTPISKTLRPERDNSINFDVTENLFIEGDNLDSLNLLRETYLGKIKLIYIDPPYNTGNDFVYNDDFKSNSNDYLVSDGQKDTSNNRLVENTESNGRFHSDWLSMMYARLKIARDLLADDGLIFISNDDWENHNLRKICDGIFGENNIINHRQLIWHLPDGTNKGLIARAHEYILGYGKDIRKIKPFNRPADKSSEYSERLTNAPGPKNKISQIYFRKGLKYEGKDKVFSGVIGDKEPITIKGQMVFKNGILAEDVILESSWRNKSQIVEFLEKGIAFDEKGQKISDVFFKSNGKPMYVKNLSTFSPKSVQQFKMSKFENTLREEMSFSNPKPIALIKWLASLVVESGDTVLDFFAGSGTTGHAIMELNSETSKNLKFILCQLDEKCHPKSDSFAKGYKTITEITRQRLKLSAQEVYSNSNHNQTVDIGFRSFKIDTSNMADVY